MGPGETRDDQPGGEGADLTSVALDDGLAHGHLTVAGDHRRTALANGEDVVPCQLGKSCVCSIPAHVAARDHRVKDDELFRRGGRPVRRHLVLREIGGPGQQKLKAASVAIVGAGGLGAPAALYMAAAGVGRIVLVDHDTVSLSNLQRQVLYQTEDVGALKVDVAARRLDGLNPHISIEPAGSALTAGNARDLVSDVDLVLDGTDNFPVRFVVSKACLESGRPLVSGAIGRWTVRSGCSPASHAIAAWFQKRHRMRRHVPRWVWSVRWPG